jgi:hypothetical protein
MFQVSGSVAFGELGFAEVPSSGFQVECSRFCINPLKTGLISIGFRTDDSNIFFVYPMIQSFRGGAFHFSGAT